MRVTFNTEYIMLGFTPIGEKLNLLGATPSPEQIGSFISEIKERRKAGENVTDAVILPNGTRLYVAGMMAAKGQVDALLQWEKAGENVTDAQILTNGTRVTVAGTMAAKGQVNALKQWKQAGENVTDAAIFTDGSTLTVAGIMATKGQVDALKQWQVPLPGGGRVTALGMSLFASHNNNQHYRHRHESHHAITAAQNTGLSDEAPKDVVFIDRRHCYINIGCVY